MADISVLNTTAQISGATLVTEEGNFTITGSWTFDNDPSAPFSVASGSAVVTNLDADYLDGQHGAYYRDADNLNAGTVPTARLGSGTADTTTFLRGDSSWATAGPDQTGAETISGAWVFTGNPDIGDGTEADFRLGFNGNALDFHLGLDDSQDLLIAGVGDTLGTTSGWSLDSAQRFSIYGAPRLLGIISPSQLTANTHDWAPTGHAQAAVIRASTDASRQLTGITGGVNGRVLLIVNVGSNDLVLVDESGSSTAANRFAIGSNRTLNTDEAAMVFYDGTDSRWRLMFIP